MANAVKWLSLTEDLPSLGSTHELYFGAEAVVQEFEDLASTTLIPLSGDSIPNQPTELLQSDTRTATSRSPQAQITGVKDQGEMAITFNPQFPSALGGTDKPSGWDVIMAFFGSQNIVAGQSAYTIQNVQSLTNKEMQLDVNAAAGTFDKGDVLALRRTPSTGAGEGEHTYVIAETDLGGSPNQVRLTCRPGFSITPTETTDAVRGGISAVPDEEFLARYSALVKAGYRGAYCFGGVINTLSFGFDRRSIFKVEAGYQFQGMSRASNDQVRGDASTDGFTTGDLTLRLGDVRRFFRTPWVDLKKITVATDVVAGTETKAKVGSIDVTNGTVTFSARGSSPVSATDLTAVTSTQEVAETYDTDIAGSPAVLRLNIDNRGDIDITLPGTATDSAADIVASINAALAASSLYSRYTSAFSSTVISWETVASAVSSKVRLTSQCWGSQSRIQVKDTGASTSAHAIIFTGTFDISATDEVQVIPYTPAGTASGTELAGHIGFSKIDGALLPSTSLTVSNSNDMVWLTNARLNDNMPQGSLPGPRQQPEISCTVTDMGWTSALERLAEDETSVTFLFQVGTALGKSLSVFCNVTKIGNVTSQGEHVRETQFTARPEYDAPNVMEAMYAGFA